MSSFLQSQNWLKFQESLGRKVWQVDSINIIKYNLPFGKSYLYSPRCRGNFLSDSFLKKIKEIAKKENSIFFKIEPVDIDKDLMKKSGFKKASNIQPKRTLILDITKSEQELLKQMHHKTRYNIKLAEKKGIEIKKDKKYFEEFWRLLKDTAKKGGFHTHLKEHYKEILEVPGVELFAAEFKGKIIAANIIIFYPPLLTKSGGQATYLHGALDYQYRNLMAPHLLQWYQILEAKKRGCIEYDLWGIDEKKWPGVTRFKKGFGGKEIDYIGAHDLVFQPLWYSIYKIARKIL